MKKTTATLIAGLFAIAAIAAIAHRQAPAATPAPAAAHGAKTDGKAAGTAAKTARIVLMAPTVTVTATRLAMKQAT